MESAKQPKPETAATRQNPNFTQRNCHDKTTLAALVCSALIAGSAQASVTVEGTTFDDTSAVAGQNLVLNGAGLRKKLFSVFTRLGSTSLRKLRR